MRLYHGSVNIIEKPEYGIGNHKNDYGLGFYCTENIELAKEWACSTGKNGFVNIYDFDIDNFSICDLTGLNILNWMAVLLENRTFNLSEGVAYAARDYILENFSIDYKSSDIIKGYRAADSYFAFARDFLNNEISLEDLSVAMKLGKLGEQVVVKSQKAFDALVFHNADFVDSRIHNPKWSNRDKNLSADYQVIKSRSNIVDGLFVIDIIRQQLKRDDERLR